MVTPFVYILRSDDKDNGRTDHKGASEGGQEKRERRQGGARERDIDRGAATRKRGESDSDERR